MLIFGVCGRASPVHAPQKSTNCVTSKIAVNNRPLQGLTLVLYYDNTGLVYTVIGVMDLSDPGIYYR
jgi:hypothetical protein